MSDTLAGFLLGRLAADEAGTRAMLTRWQVDPDRIYVDDPDYREWRQALHAQDTDTAGA